MIFGSAPFEDLINKEISLNKFGYGIGISATEQNNKILYLVNLEYVRNYEDEESLNSVLLNINIGKLIFERFGFYLGWGFGLQVQTDDFKIGPAYKASGGFLLYLPFSCFSVGASYNNTTKFCVDLGFGIAY